MKNILTFANKHRVTQLSDHTTIIDYVKIPETFQNLDCDAQSEEHAEDEAAWLDTSGPPCGRTSSGLHCGEPVINSWRQWRYNSLTSNSPACRYQISNLKAPSCPKANLYRSYVEKSCFQFWSRTFINLPALPLWLFYLYIRTNVYFHTCVNVYTCAHTCSLSTLHFYW